MKKTLAIALVVLIVITNKPAYCTNNKLSNLNTRYIVLMDFKSGRVLFEKESRKVVPMASTTKIMTAIIALEESNLNDIVIVSKRASSIHGSSIGLKYGDKLTMEELLYGLMLRSGNDCAIAIAEHISGSVEKFAELMNSKAFDIGAFNTHFSTPHGLDKDGHFTTAYDLALITKYAFNNTKFHKIVASKNVTINGINGQRSFRNINKILLMVNGADGVKTGYTGKAGKCLVSSASRDDKRVICVVLDSHNRWNDSKALLEYGFSKYKDSIFIDSKDYTSYITVDGGKKSNIKVGLDNDLTIPISDEEKNNISFKMFLPDRLAAPLYKGQQLGQLIIYYKEKKLYSIPCKALEDVERSKAKSMVEKLLNNIKLLKSND